MDGTFPADPAEQRYYPRAEVEAAGVFDVAAACPETVQVGPFRYDVKVDKAAMNAVCRSEQRDLLGSHATAPLALTLDPDQALGQKRDTLLHECLHAIMAQGGVNLDHDAQEAVIARLSPAILDLLRRNPDLVAFLIGVED